MLGFCYDVLNMKSNAWCSDQGETLIHQKVELLSCSGPERLAAADQGKYRCLFMV
jgi:hypothetical protein